MRRRLLQALVLAAIGGFAGASLSASGHPAAHPSGARCHTVGSGALIRPDDRCTPGEYLMLTRSEVCRHKQRPSLSADVKRRVVGQYGYRHWSGRDGELDHRVPFFLGGATTEDNLWPQAGPIPNRKDRVEFRVYALVCEQRSMTIAEARAVFLGDWTKFRGA